jgi:hypothetical protein
MGDNTVIYGEAKTMVLLALTLAMLAAPEAGDDVLVAAPPEQGTRLPGFFQQARGVFTKAGLPLGTRSVTPAADPGGPIGTTE